MWFFGGPLWFPSGYHQGRGRRWPHLAQQAALTKHLVATLNNPWVIDDATPSTKVEYLYNAIRRQILHEGEAVTMTARSAGRLAVMIQQRTSGMTLEAIGREHGITRQRARQILALHDKDYDGRQFFGIRHEARLEKIRRQANENPLAPKSSLGERATVEEAIGQAGAFRHKGLRTVGAWTPSRSRALIYEDLREAAGLSAKRYLSMKDYDQHRRPASLTSGRVAVVFGSWKNATQMAGLVMGKVRRSGYTRGWTDDEVREWLIRFVDEAPSLTQSALTKWLQAQDGSPSTSLIEGRFGGWTEVRRAAMATSAARRIVEPRSRES